MNEIDEISNASLCSELIRTGILRIRLLDTLVEKVPSLEKMPDPDRIAGMLLGLAVGDSLGNTSEAMRPAVRRMKHGEIRDYLPKKYAGGRAVGLPTDDTQLAFWTLDEILKAGRVDPEKISTRFTRDSIFGMGQAVRDFLLARALGKSWREAGQESAGNGALMRVAPLVLPSLRQGGLDFLSDVVLGAAITHNDSAAVSSCVA